MSSLSIIQYGSHQLKTKCRCYSNYIAKQVSQDSIVTERGIDPLPRLLNSALFFSWLDPLRTCFPSRIHVIIKA